MTDFILPTYNRTALRFERGEGCWLITENDNQRYLDFSSGIAVNALGYNHPVLNNALNTQMQKLWHCSNLYQIPLQEKLAKLLCSASNLDWAFFCNSGTEACDLAVKIVRRYWNKEGQTSRTQIIGLKNAFHGRSAAGIAASGGQNMIDGFAPILPDFVHIEYEDIDALSQTMNDKTAAVILEPIQGEGGIRPISQTYFKKLEDLCRENGTFFITDEVQAGTGRTGRFFAHEWAGVKPDIVMMAKGIGGGFPLGAVLINKRAGKHMTAGSHGATYGGNPLAMAVGIAIFETINSEKFLSEVRRKGVILANYLEKLVTKYSDIFESYRGQGLMYGLKCKIPLPDFIAAGRKVKLLTVPAKENIARLLPPLIVSEEELEIAYKRLCEAAEICRANVHKENVVIN